MKDLPKPILGEITAFTIATPDLEKSLAFYQKLGYAEVFRADYPFPWIQVTDGVVLIMLRKDPKPYIALTYYVKNIDKVVAGLDKKEVPFASRAKPTDMLKRFLITTPDGLNVSLVGIVEGFTQPKGPGMLAMKPEDYANPGKYVNKTCGLFGEFAHPVADLEKSLDFWKLLGFAVVSKFTSPYPWAIISDGLSIVGLHQSTHFTAPALTYFAADMGDKIANLKTAGLKNFKEQGGGNIVITTPEQQHIFLYQLGLVAHDKNKVRPPLQQTIIETPRLLLKELNPDVMTELFTSWPDAEIMKQLGLVKKEELEAERTKFEQGYSTYRTSFRSFMLVDKETGTTVGSCGFHTWYLLHSRAEIGYAMTDDSVKAKGFMTEAIRAVIKYGFDEMKLNRVEAFIGKENVPSLKLVKGLGFVEEGTMRSHYFKNGEMQDSVCFSLLRSEYKPK